MMIDECVGREIHLTNQSLAFATALNVEYKSHMLLYDPHLAFFSPYIYSSHAYFHMLFYHHQSSHPNAPPYIEIRDKLRISMEDKRQRKLNFDCFLSKSKLFSFALII